MSGTGDTHDGKFGARFDRKGHVIQVVSDARALGGQEKEAVVMLERPKGSPFTLRCDEGPYLNGNDKAPPPLSFLTSSIGF